jgi:hypothetical protein
VILFIFTIAIERLLERKPTYVFSDYIFDPMVEDETIV